MKKAMILLLAASLLGSCSPAEKTSHQGIIAYQGRLQEALERFPEPRPLVSNGEKITLMRRLAPLTYMDRGESYFPSTVEFSFPHLTRYLNDGTYWVKTKDSLPSPSSGLDYFGGDLANAKVYAFWVEKDHEVMEITYFFHYPYNRGKEMVDTIWGNHVGDWEHVTVRLGWTVVDNGWQLKPFEVYLSAHAEGHTRSWEATPKTDDLHPIVFSARGSHAMYFTTGAHDYKTIPLLGTLTDRCSKGEAFDLATGDRIVFFDWETKTGMNGDPWPTWMSSEFTVGGANPSDAAAGAIFRWGNTERGCEFGFGQCRLENGPTGPVSKKGVWDPHVFER